MSSLFIVFAGICWGLDGLLRSKISGLSPLSIVTLEHIIGFVLLGAILFRTWRFPKLTKNAWLVLVSVALFSGLIGTYAFTWAMANVSFTSFGVLFLILKLQPIFAILAAFIFLGERPKKSFYLLALVALVAAYFLSFGKSGLHLPTLGDDATKAVLAGLVAALCWGSATVFSRYLSHQGYNAREMTSYRLGMTAVLGIITLMIFSLFGVSFEFSSLTAISFGFIAAVALLSGVVGTTLYYRGIKGTPATLASIFELSFPLTGFIIDIFVSHKAPDVVQIVGGICVILVMIIIGRKHS